MALEVYEELKPNLERYELFEGYYFYKYVSILQEVKDYIIKAYIKLNDVEPTEKQIVAIYKSLKECQLI